jgi:hypothetical protein
MERKGKETPQIINLSQWAVWKVALHTRVVSSSNDLDSIMGEYIIVQDGKCSQVNQMVHINSSHAIGAKSRCSDTEWSVRS